MTPEFFGRVLDALWGKCWALAVNGAGDYLTLPNHQEFSDVLAERHRHAGQGVTVITNGGYTGDVPRITCNELHISLNATTPEDFDTYIGIPGGLYASVDRIRALIAGHGNVEIHSLKWEHNLKPALPLLRFFGDTHAKIRISGKVENQCRGQCTEARVPCDYLAGVTVTPDGRLRQCVHDWDETTVFGDVFNLDEGLARRDAMRQRHEAGEFPGVCDNCNYPLKNPPAIYYIK